MDYLYIVPAAGDRGLIQAEGIGEIPHAAKSGSHRNLGNTVMVV